MEAALQGELKEAGANLDNVIKVMSYRTISEGPRRYWARVRVCACVVIIANASPESSCTEMRWTLGTQPLKTCVTGPVEGKHQSGGAGTQNQELVLRPHGSQRDQSGHTKKPERLPPRTSPVRSGRTPSQKKPLCSGAAGLANPNIKQTRRGGAESNVLEALHQTHGSPQPGTAALWPHSLMEGHPEGTHRHEGQVD